MKMSTHSQCHRNFQRRTLHHVKKIFMLILVLFARDVHSHRLPATTELPSPSISGRRRRWVLSKFTSHREGSSNNIPGKTSSITLHSRGGSASVQSVASTCFFLIIQSLNVGTAAIIGSGGLGAWVSSILIVRLQKLASESNSFLSSLTSKKWSLTIIASVSYLLLNVRGIIQSVCFRNAASALSIMSDASFVFSLWLYSYAVNPVLGGVIGCAHVLIGVSSSLLSSSPIVNSLNVLPGLRLKSLDDDGGVLSEAELNEQGSSVTFRSVLSNAFASISLLTSYPRYFLGLYLASSAVLSLISSHEINFGGDWMVWLNDGLLGDGDPRNMTMRLLALHWIDMFIKVSLACVRS